MRYDIDTVRWVIENYVSLSNGVWPDPKNDDNHVKKPGISHRASFENPVILAAEISRRVRECGLDGLVVQLYSGMLTGIPMSIDGISQIYYIDITTIHRRINKVAWYCTDKEYKRRLNYENWKKNRHYRRKFVREGQFAS